MSTPSKRLKLSYVINNLNVGGAEKLLLSTVKKLDKTAFDITVFSMLSGNQLAHEFEAAGANVVYLDMTSKRDLTGLLKLYRSFKKNKFDIVHTHLIEADIFGRYAAIFAGIPIIVSTEHSINAWKKNPTRLKSKLRLILDRIAAQRSNAIVAVSQKVKDHLVMYEQIPAKKIVVIMNGVEIVKAPKSLPRKNSTNIVIGSVGRLFEEKGYEFLLKAYGRVRESIPNLSLRIAGDGPSEQVLKKLAADLGIGPNVEFLGSIDDIPGFLNQIDIFVLSSLREGIPLSLLEAMSFGKPVIATSVGGVPEVIEDGKDGLLVESKSITQLHDAIIQLIKNERRGEILGTNARLKIVKDFDLCRTVMNLSSLYERLIENANAHGQT